MQVAQNRQHVTIRHAIDLAAKDGAGGYGASDG